MRMAIALTPCVHLASHALLAPVEGPRICLNAIDGSEAFFIVVLRRISLNPSASIVAVMKEYAMQLTCSTSDGATLKADVLIVPAFEYANPLKDFGYGTDLKKLLFKGQFDGKAGELAVLPGSGIVGSHTVILVGLGKRADFELAALRNGVCAAIRDESINKSKAKHVAVDLSDVLAKLGSDKCKVPGGAGGPTLPMARWLGQAVAEGLELGGYVYDRLFNLVKDDKVPARPTKGSVIAEKAAHTELKKGFALGAGFSDGVNLARSLCNDPNSHLKPAQLAAAAQKACTGVANLTCKVHNKAQLEKWKMGAFLSVNAGSDDKDGAARLICMEYKGGKAGDAPICLVGKGLTFDTGGYSLKPAAAMLGMKWDMGGAATMIGAIVAIARAKLPVNVVCVVPTTENLVNEIATKPGDVVTAMNGMTIEVNNTDAEGRLILCDALTYAQKTYKPDTIIDSATLTGAALVALGDQYFAVLSNDDGVAAELADATKDAAELSWRLPLPKEYISYLDSKIADTSNIGGRMAGTITAGLFLQKFINDGQKWAHLDIAGVADNHEGKQKGVAPTSGGTGTAVRTLVAFARARCNA